MSKRSHWRFFLLRWHRRIGVVLALFLVWMSLSGVVINHAAGLGLDRQLLENRFWLSRYGVSGPHDFLAGERPFRLSSEGLQSGQAALGGCDLLLGVAQVPDGLVLACDSRILLLTAQGELVEQTDLGRGLPGPFSAMSVEGGVVRLKRADGQVLRLETLDLSLQPAAGPRVWLTPVPAPAAITRERLLLDLHSGRLFGRFGPWLVDFLAVAVVVLAFSGWALARKRHHKM